MISDRLYNVWEMGHVFDELSEYDGTRFYRYIYPPSWFNTELISAGQWFPSYSFLPPHGTAGTFSIPVSERDAVTGAVFSTATITINVKLFDNPPWKIDHCHTANLIWLDPSGGWESYMFMGKQQAFQDKGKSATYINSEGEKRFHRKDEVHQGVIVTTGKVTSVHADYIADAFKSIQAYLVFTPGQYVPIIIDPKTFRKVRTGDSYAEYEFEFRHAVQDVIQTQ